MSRLAIQSHKPTANILWEGYTYHTQCQWLDINAAIIDNRLRSESNQTFSSPDTATISQQTLNPTMSLDLPPGLVHLLGLAPYFLKPSIVVYFALKLLQKCLGLNLSLWLTLVLCLFARPILFFFDQYYSHWVNKREAAAHNAILAPTLPESPLSLVTEFAESITHGYPGEAMLRWAQTYGKTVQFKFFNTTIMSTVEPTHVKAFLATQFESFEKGEVLFSQAKSFLGTGVFNSDGDMWRFHRGITRPFFTRDRISDFEIYARNCDVSMKAAQTRLSKGYSIDFQDLVARFTLDSSTEYLFGGSVDSLNGPIPFPPAFSHENSPEFYNHPSTIFVKAMSEASIITAVRTIRGSNWPLLEFWKDDVKPLREILDSITEPLIMAALENRQRELHDATSIKVQDGEEETLIAHLVKKTQNIKILKDEIINLLLAGRDTTMILLTMSVYMLAEHPHLEARLRAEMNTHVGATGNPTYDQIRELKYMRAFFNEVLRLYPPVPINFKTNTKPVVLPPTEPGQKPIYVPKNTTCLFTLINIQRRADLWGPDAHEFDPDRFLDERLQKYYIPNPFIFSPFNAGPRICLGQQFAYNEAAFYFVRLLQQFTKFTLDDSANAPPPKEWASSSKLERKHKEKVHPMSHLTMYVKGGLWVRMEDVAKSSIV